MRTYMTIILLGFLGLTAVILIGLMYQTWIAGPADDRITEAKVETQVENIYWYSTAYKAAFIAVLGVLLVSALMISYSIAKSRLKKAAVHTYKIGKYNEVVVHEKDLSIAAPIAMGLMNAEQLKQMNGGVERAFDLYTKMAEVQTKQIQSLVGRRGLTQISSGSEITPPFQSTSDSAMPQIKDIPTFQELLASGDIAHGKSMILGFENGVPRRGSFLDIYSAAVAGESGSGKTATLLFLIGSGLIAEKIRFIGIDPHYPHPKSLGYKTRPIWEAGLMKMATFKDDMLAVLNQVEGIIDHRLRQIDTDTTPVVLVIDELAFLAKTSIGSAIAHTMERISTEGRKCAVYMLASSQTWLVARTGDSSVVRDTLTSAFVHRIKPKQANLLLQDKEEAEKVKKYIKQAGDVLLCPVNDESVVCKMPFTTETDMQTVVNLLKSEVIDISECQLQEGQSSSLPIPPEMRQIPESSGSNLSQQLRNSKAFDAKLLTAQILREQMDASPLGSEKWLKQLSSNSGVSETLVQQIMEGNKKLSIRTARKLIPYLFSDQ
ncbi:MAG: hypothetical protein RBT80_22390 [Candidatus Vecturithrix sp.]|nr:hypothetical protein [Candidatus Vecturithrix sp.]